MLREKELVFKCGSPPHHGELVNVNIKSMLTLRQLDHYCGLVSLAEQNVGKAEMRVKRELNSNKIPNVSSQR